jgi:hypothetical protein
MDFVVFTDHDTIDGALDLLSRRPDLEPDLIIGEEVETYFPQTGQWVHVNVFGVDEPIHADLARLRASVYDLSAYLKSKKLFHVLNHPFQSYRLQSPPMRYIEEVLELFDHFEVGNCTLPARHNKAVAEMLDYAAALYTKKIGGGAATRTRCATWPSATPRPMCRRAAARRPGWPRWRAARDARSVAPSGRRAWRPMSTGSSDSTTCRCAIQMCAATCARRTTWPRPRWRPHAWPGCRPS